MPTFKGAWPALVTPHGHDGSVNLPVLRDLVDYLAEKGIGGLYVCGSTGEGVFMSVADRQQTLETVIDQLKGRAEVIAHVGSMVAGDAVALAVHAQEVGADGVSSIIPAQYTNLGSIVDYYARIGEAAPDLPLVAYVINASIAVIPFMQALLLIPTMAGAKYTGPNMFEFRQLVEMGSQQRSDNGWYIFSGMDEQCLFASMLGSNGNIGTTLNYHSGGYAQIHQLVKAGEHDQALDLQLRLNRVTEIAITMGFPGALRTMMERLGFPCGEPRLPNRSFSDGDRLELNRQLDSAGFDELAAL